MHDVISDAAAEEGEEAIGWMFPSRGRASEASKASIGWTYLSNGFLLLGSSIADDVAHNTNKGSIARAQQGINSKSKYLVDDSI